MARRRCDGSRRPDRRDGGGCGDQRPHGSDHHVPTPGGHARPRQADFRAHGGAGVLAAVESTGRRTAVLVGAETDVCVAHSAVGLKGLGFSVAVVSDATFSPGEMHELGLRHVRDAGIEVRHAKGVYYDWIRTLEAARAFVRAHPDLTDPPGFRL